MRRRSAMRALVALAFVLGLSMAAYAQNLEFNAPPSIDDPELAPRLRDLAQRALPVYQDNDSLRFLSRLSALQTVAGSTAAADDTRHLLRDRRRAVDPARPVEGTSSEAELLDVYTHARALQAAQNVPFEGVFAAAFHEGMATMDDRVAYSAISRLPPLPGALTRDLRQSLERARAEASLPLGDAVQLVWNYYVYQAWLLMRPQLGALEAEEEQRRFAVQRDIPIRMADGVSVYATLVLPRSARGTLPALLEFALDAPSPGQAMRSAAHGYAGILAYSRRPSKDPAAAGPFVRDGDDARAVIRWIVRQPWSDGRVGMLGERYSGFAAWAAAKHPPRALKAIATFDPIAPGIDFPMRGSIFHPAAYRWILNRATAADGETAPVLDDSHWHTLQAAWYRSGTPCGTLDTLSGRPSSLYHLWLDHPDYDSFWQRMVPYQHDYARINIPILTMAGYFDEGAVGALYYLEQHERYNSKADHTLLIGPFDRSTLTQGPASDLRGYLLDPQASVDLRELRYQWFDQILRGGGKSPLLQERVNFQVMQADEWRHVPALPSAGAKGPPSLRLYLGTDSAGRGRLAEQNDAHWREFVAQTVNLADRGNAEWVPPVQLPTREPDLQDALIFAGEALQRPLDVAGMLSGEFEVALNRRDADLNLRLYELQPNGVYVPLFDPPIELRASYARDRTHRHLLRPAERQRIAFGGERFTSRRIGAGSRLIVVIGINRRPDREVNFGSGKEVRRESARVDGTPPLNVRWYRGTHIDLPLSR